jgi:hypothetical protein
MKLYRFSPISSYQKLIEAIQYTHIECNTLCFSSFKKYIPIAGNIGIFCHYQEEFLFLKKLQKEITIANDAWNQKYFQLIHPIFIPQENNIPSGRYTHLYIRKPDPYRSHV